MSDKTEFIELKCTYCGSIFKKTIHRWKEAKKMGWKPYCSKKCIGLSKKTSIEEKCTNCGKSIEVINSIFKKSESKHFFCNNSCAASFNNRMRGGMSESTKEKISKGLARFYKREQRYINERSCLICGKKFKPKKPTIQCCSRECGCIYQFGSLPYTKEDVISGILNRFEELSRTPQKRDCKRRLASAADRLFGTWNKAVKACGLKPNPSKYQKVRLKCKDGHMSDSISEMLVDNWFYNNNIKHERGKKYQGTNMDCDFYLSDYDLWVEYFGLINQSDEYDKTVSVKREFIKKNNLNFIGIQPKDLYPDMKLDELFKNIIK